MKPPNILFIFSDQHRASALGCYGNKEVLSPNINMLSERGIRFENFISNCPVCVPARASLLTGLLPPKHGAVSNDMPIFNGVEGIADVLGGNGYYTGYIGKWHIDGVPRDKAISKHRRLGFKYWKVNNCNHNYLSPFYYDENNVKHIEKGYDPIIQTDLAIDFIKENKDKSWALFLSWGPPHDPYMAVPQCYLNMIDDSKITLAENVPLQSAAAAYIDGRLGKKMIDKNIIKKHLHGYYAHIAALDEQLGKLVQTLEKEGICEDTIVIYTSDHGDMLGGNGYTGKQLPYKDSYNIPLIVSQKNNIKAGVSSALFSQIDLPVSLLGLLGLRFSQNVDGKDFSQCLTDCGAQADDACLIADYIPAHNAVAHFKDAWRGIVTVQYTYAAFEKEDFVLFDNINDPLQINNLIYDDKYSNIKAEIKEKLLQKLETHGDRLQNTFDFIIEKGFKEAWDTSQSYFNLPLTDSGKLY